MQWIRRPARAAISGLISLSLTSCGAGTVIEKTVVGSGPELGTPVQLTGFIGAVAGDEPRAVRIGQSILLENGSAADAAVAMGFALAVTLPSRAGLGGGGACLVFDPSGKSPGRGMPEAIMFTPRAPAQARGDRPAAIPMMARGLFALQARYGVLPVAKDIVPAERLARFGTPVSQGFAADLAVVGGALLKDQVAAAVFGPQGSVLAEGDLMVQGDLGATLARMRLQGARDLYAGGLAEAFAAGAATAGGPVTVADLANAVPTLADPITLSTGKDEVSFLPPPADGGLAAAASFKFLQGAPEDLDGAQARALGAAASWRKGGSPSQILADAPQAAEIGALPASTSFIALDRTGTAVACAITMGNLFGTGRMVAGTGILLAASPARVPSPLLAAAIAWNRGARSFRAAVAGSGQEKAALGVAYGMARTLRAKVAMPATVPSPGRINAIACPAGLPGDAAQCTWATDPRGSGLAVGSQ